MRTQTQKTTWCDRIGPGVLIKWDSHCWTAMQVSSHSLTNPLLRLHSYQFWCCGRNTAFPVGFQWGLSVFAVAVLAAFRNKRKCSLLRPKKVTIVMFAVIQKIYKLCLGLVNIKKEMTICLFFNHIFAFTNMDSCANRPNWPLEDQPLNPALCQKAALPHSFSMRTLALQRWWLSP